ncbi:MAG: TonB-dependent receptor [Bacteroidetes bacterium]|nr:TonB-dependent receptor [Bacteroidota bacterium]MCW5894767.1 TonB-dependent receptor [Bacteroidota bacterium]
MLLTLLYLPPAFPLAGFAQIEGSIEGTIRQTKTALPIVGANAVVVDLQRGAVSDSAGSFRINGIPAGRYTLQISSIGYRAKRIRLVGINPGLRTRIEIELDETPIELDAVQVIAERPPILKDVVGTTHAVSQEQIEALPVSSFADVVGLQPGITSDLHVRGGKTSEVVYLVDGLPIQDLIGGGAGSDIPKSSIAGLLVQTGGYEAEHGNALSGVVNVVTRRGGDSHEVLLRAEKDNLFGGKQVNRAHDVELSASGPIALNEFYYFASARFQYTDTRYWQDFRRFFSSPISRQCTGFGKVDYRGSPTIRLSAQLLYSLRDWRDYEFSWRFNLTGLPPRNRNSYRTAVLFSHTPSTTTTYSVTLSRYWLNTRIGGDRNAIDTTLYEYDFFLQYILHGNRSWWAESKQTVYTLKGDLDHQLGDQHLMKAGVEMNMYSITSDVVRYEPRLNVFGKPFVSKPLLNYSTDYSYRPYSGSAYVQDKVELRKDGMLLSVGLRYDFLDPTAERPATELAQTGQDEFETKITHYVPARRKQYFSPRIGFAAPFAENGYLFVNYGHFVQFPLFDYLYSGLNNVSLRKGVGVLIGNPDLEAEKTKAWEISIKYALHNEIVFSATYFDKTTYNQIDVKTFIPSNARIAGDYGFAEFVNNPYAKATGLELTIAREKRSWLTGSLSYTIMQAEGLSQDARQGLSYYQWGLQIPARLFPLSWDERHNIKLVANMSLPWDVNININWSFHSGRPFTYYPTTDGFTPLDSTIKFQPNNRSMTEYSQVDVKASKTFASLTDFFRLTVFVDVRNLLNKENVLWVDSSGKIGGELGDISAFSQPRRTTIGVRLEL